MSPCFRIAGRLALAPTCLYVILYFFRRRRPCPTATRSASRKRSGFHRSMEKHAAFALRFFRESRPRISGFTLGRETRAGATRCAAFPESFFHVDVGTSTLTPTMSLWLSLPRMWWGVVDECGGGFGLITPPRPPPPVVLPAAAFASLCLGGAFAPGFALRARATAHGLGRFLGTCRDGSARSDAVRDVSVWRGAEKGAIWGGVDVANDNRQDSSHLRLA